MITSAASCSVGAFSLLTIGKYLQGYELMLVQLNTHKRSLKQLMSVERKIEFTEFFYAQKKSKYGIHSWCKACYEQQPSMIAKRQRWKEKQKIQSRSEKC